MTEGGPKARKRENLFVCVVWCGVVGNDCVVDNGEHGAQTNTVFIVMIRFVNVESMSF